MRARFSFLLCLVATPFLHAQDASYALTPAAAEKWIRATQQLVVNGATPNVQGSMSPADLSKVKTALDVNPAAQQALASADLTSTEYVSFMGAAMTAMMVGQMEMAGVRGMLPPGVTTRPSQQNIDFMKSNLDLFERSMRPGAPTAAAPAANAARAAASDEALPMPAAAGDVLPSSILARLLPLDRITGVTDCTAGRAQELIEKESGETQALQNAYYGNPGDSGLARTAAEGAILERLEDSDLESCGREANGGLAFAPEYLAADRAWSEASNRIAEEQQDAWAACPGIPGGKEPACERQVNADAARKMAAAQQQFLASVSQPFAARIEALRACTVKREAIVADAKAADVRGANVKLVLRPLAVAWQQVMFPVAEWSGLCETAQRYIRE
jgi:hypothetical protein